MTSSKLTRHHRATSATPPPCHDCHCHCTARATPTPQPQPRHATPRHAATRYSYYREHTHALASGIDPGAIMAELFAKDTGTCRGTGGSMHIYDVDTHFQGGWALVSEQLPYAAGAARSILLDRELGQASGLLQWLTTLTADATLHTPHFILLTPYSSLHTPHSTLLTPYSALHTPHSILHTPHSSLLTPHPTLHTPHSSLLTPHPTLHTPHPTLLTPHSSLHTPYSALRTPHSALRTPHTSHLLTPSHPHTLTLHLARPRTGMTA